MPELSTLTLFLTASFFLVVVPGPTIALIISKSIAQGRQVALPMILGIAAGGALAATLALTGVSVILMASSTAFNALKLLGALYLFYMGFKLLIAKPQEFSKGSRRGMDTPYRAFRDGFFVMLFNPKGILFFAVFVPQFIDPVRAFAPQAAILVVSFALVGIIVDTGYALLASTAGNAIKSPKLQSRVSKTAGFTIMGAGVITLFAKPPQT